MRELFLIIITNIFYLTPFSILTLIPFWGAWKLPKSKFYASLALFNAGLVAFSVIIVYLGFFENGLVQVLYGYVISGMVFLFCLRTVKAAAAKLAYVFIIAVTYLTYEGNIIFFIEARIIPEHYNAYDSIYYIMLHSLLLLVSAPFVVLFFRRIVRPIVIMDSHQTPTWKIMWLVPTIFWIISSIYIGIFSIDRLMEIQFFVINFLLAFGSFFIYYLVIKMVALVEKNARMEARALLRIVAELIEFRDNGTGTHVERSRRYLGLLIDMVIKKAMYPDETDKWDIQLIGSSARLHDVGKIAVSDGILRKPGKLTEDEFEEIKTHSIFGKKIIDKIGVYLNDENFLRYAKIIAETHHEKWDGNGYPHGLKGEEIPLEGRLMAIADVYDALVSERPYRKSLTHEEAVGIIKSNRGTHFDPAIVDVFLEIADRFEEISNEAIVETFSRDT